jgi:hypothetical protein
MLLSDCQRKRHLKIQDIDSKQKKCKEKKMTGKSVYIEIVVAQFALGGAELEVPQQHRTSSGQQTV